MLQMPYRQSCSRTHALLAFCLALPLLLLSAASASASEKQFNIESETILRAYERQDRDGKDNSLVPLYEYLTVDYGSPLAAGFTFQAHGWGRQSLSGSDFYDHPGEGELLYGYVGYRFSQTGPEVKLGRQTIFTGLMSQDIDGLGFQTPFSRWITISAYGGAPAVDGEYTERRDQRIYGGRTGFNLGAVDLGVSYQTIQDAKPQDDKRLGVDLYAVLFADMVFSGYSSLNTVSSTWAEHAYELQIPIGNILIAPMYQKFRFEDMFDQGSESSGPFRFLGATDEVLTAAGGDVRWLSGPIEIGVQVRNYSYDQQSESNLYSAAFFNWAAPDKTSVSLECGLMNADNPQNEFILARTGIKTGSLPFLSSKDTVSADLMYVHYTEPIYSRKDSYSAVAGYSRRIFRDKAALVLSGDYSHDPYFDQDIGATLIFLYDGGSGAVEIQP